MSVQKLQLETANFDVSKKTPPTKVPEGGPSDSPKVWERCGTRAPRSPSSKMTFFKCSTRRQTGFSSYDLVKIWAKFWKNDAQALNNHRNQELLKGNIYKIWKKRWKMKPSWSQKSALIQPRTSLGKGLKNGYSKRLRCLNNVTMSSVWWIEVQQWQTNRSKHSKKNQNRYFLFVPRAKSHCLNTRFGEGGVFDLSHMRKRCASQNPGFWWF